MKNPFEVFIERRLLLQDQKTHSTSNLRILIGRPHWTKGRVEAACPVAIEGWLGRVADITGADPMSAMEMALFFINSLFKQLSVSEKVTWPDGDKYEGTFPDSSLAVPDALLHRMVEIQQEVFSKRHAHVRKLGRRDAKRRKGAK